MADVTDSKSVGSDTVRVQVPLPAPITKKTGDARLFSYPYKVLDAEPSKPLGFESALRSKKLGFHKTFRKACSKSEASPAAGTNN